MGYEEFYELTHDEIANIILDNYKDCRDILENINQELMSDKRSQSLKNRGKEYGRAFAALEKLMEDLHISPDKDDM